MELDKIDMYSDNCVAFQWSYEFDGSRRIGALTTFGRYDPNNEKHVKMNLDDLPTNFLRDYAVDRFIYYPSDKKNPEKVEEDYNYENFVERKLEDIAKKNPKPQEPEVAKEDKEKEELRQEVNDLRKQVNEILKSMNGGS